MTIILIIIAVLLAANIVVSWLNADAIATAIFTLSGIKPPQPIKTPSKPLFKAKPKPTEEEIKYEKILTNIDNYNGTPERQVKV